MINNTKSMKRKEARSQVSLGYCSGGGVAEKVRKFESMSKNATSFVERDNNEAHKSVNSSNLYTRDRTSTTSSETQSQLQLTDPVELETIQSPFRKELNAVLWVGRETLGITGRDNNIYKIYQIDRKGSTLNTWDVEGEVRALSVNKRQELIFALCGSDSKIYKCKEEGVGTMIDLYPWEPFGVSCTKDDDILVSMRKKNDARVVHFSGTTKKKTIQYYSQKEPLFSPGSDSLALTENGNGDICVADFCGECVVVVDAIGNLRFKYRGNVYRNSIRTQFLPKHIATDVNHQILINDFSKDIIHVIDRNSSLVCYIEHKSSGGISIDSDHHLLVGAYLTGKIKVIKYLQE